MCRLSGSEGSGLHIKEKNMLRVYDLRAEYLENPIGIDARTPRFSWKIQSDGHDVVQNAYRIICISDGITIWDSGTVQSDSQRVIYGGTTLRSRQRITWQVEVDAGSWGIASQTAYFEMGLLERTDWKAKWIAHGRDNRETRLVPVFRKSFTVREGMESARLYVTSHGIYDVLLNGSAVTEDKFTPGFTSYYFRIQYGVYDVTEMLHTGDNLWITTVGDGWWRWNNNFGCQLALFGQLELTYRDGGSEIVATDGSFEVSTGSILSADLQAGEVIDARIQAGSWEPVQLTKEYADTELIACRSVPVREREHFVGKPFRDNAGNLVLDFGQNIAGYVKMILRNTVPGQKIHLKHGEGLDLEGTFSVKNCDGGMQSFQEITYICRGADEEVFQPRFSVFGFRYVLVEGYMETGIQEGDFVSIAVYSAMAETGRFFCSNELVNKLVENARWSQKGNFLDVAVDCPTRERNTWTGDAQIYCRTAAYFMDVYSFFEKWMFDQRLEQFESGKVSITFPATSSVHDPEELPFVQAKNPAMALAGPTGNGHIGEDSVGWGDSAVWIPYQLYLMYGDKRILDNQYDTARRWVDYSVRCMREPNPLYKDKPEYHTETFGEPDANYIYDTKFHYGEWNEPMPPAKETVDFFKSGKSPAEWVGYMAQFGKPIVATAYVKRSCDNLAHMAEIMGKDADAAKYREISSRVKAVYNKYLIAEDGTIEKGHQAAYIRALALDLADEEKKPLVISQLRHELEAADYHLNTGFLSTVYLLPVLCDNGMAEEAFRILEQTEKPGWLHPVKLGATTMLENWDGLDVFRDSFNHYSFGAVCEFLFGYIAGIRPQFCAPGWKEFELKPVIGGSLTYAEASFDSPYGCIASAWRREKGRLFYTCKVPVNTLAHVTLPNGEKYDVGSGEYEFTV